MTYSHEKTPWRQAQSTDWLVDHEIVIANAVPNEIPAFATDLRSMASFLSFGSRSRVAAPSAYSTRRASDTTAVASTRTAVTRPPSPRRNT